jgi:hypothetical protein
VIIKTASDVTLDKDWRSSPGLDTIHVIVGGNTTPVEVTIAPDHVQGQRVVVTDGDEHASSLPITVNGNGKLINGDPSVVLNFDGMSLSMIYDGEGWRVT